MSTLWTFALYSTLALVTAIFATVLGKLSTFAALFRGIRNLIVAASTLMVAIVYSILVFRNHNSLPNVPRVLVALLVVSNAIYLAPGIRSLFSSPAKILDPGRPL